jgi:hypothetical protein
MATVEERVDRLEHIVENFVTAVGIEFNKLYNSQMRTEAELRGFKDEMRVFKDDMGAFKDEMRAYKEEGRQQNREMNLRWGEIANKMGTLVEDLVAPSLPRIIREEFGIEPDFLGIRMKKKLSDGRVREFDAIATAGGNVVLNSTKSSLRVIDVDRFPEELSALREFFPEFTGKIVGILASLAVEEGVLRYAEEQGFLVLAVGDRLMEVKNTPGFKPKEW